MCALYPRLLASAVLCLAAVPAAIAQGQVAYRQATYQFELPEQPLAQTLRAIARQTGMNILFESKDLRDIRAASLRAELTTEEAIERVLAGTALQAQRTTPTTVIVQPAPHQSAGFRPTRGTIRLAQAEGQVDSGDDRENPAERSAVSEVTVFADRATTATKTDTKLTETPQSISVISAETIAEQGALNLEDTMRYSAGVHAEMDGNDSRYDSLIIRSVLPSSFVDGMMVSVSRAVLPRLDTYTYERVEVLRGPSGMLYGQASPGGAVNVITKRPDFGTASELGVQFGSHSRKQVQFDMQSALGGTESFAARLVGIVRDAGTQTDYVPDDRIVLSPSFAWRPSDATTLTLIGLLQQDKTASIQQYFGVTETIHAPPGRRVSDRRFAGEPSIDKLDTSQRSLTFLLNHRFSDRLQLNTSLRHTRAKADDFAVSASDAFVDPPDNRLLSRSYYAGVPHYKINNGDVSMVYSFTGARFEHKILGGLDFLGFEETGSEAFGDFAPLDIYTPLYGVFDPSMIPELVSYDSLEQTQTGVYLQDQIRYADRVSLVLGARRDRARTERGSGSEQVDRATTYRAGIIVDLGAGFSPYLSYSEAFTPVIGTNLGGRTFVPRRSRQHEVGLKWQPNASTLATANVFRIVERNRTVPDPTNVRNRIQAGEYKSQGFEFEATQRFPGNYSLIASYTYNEAEVTEHTTQYWIVGKQFSGTPRNMASIWGTKSVSLGRDASLLVGGGARYVGKSPAMVFTASGLGFDVPSYALIDAVLGLTWGSWNLALNVNNLTDKSYYPTCPAALYCFIGSRRNVVGSVTYQF